MMALSRRLVATLAAALAPFGGLGSTAHADLDNEVSLTDGVGRTLTVQQNAISLDGVLPLDRNRSTREWFHSGTAAYHVTGPNADSFSGTLELGYQVGFPWTLGTDVLFRYTTPNVLLDKATVVRASIITPRLLPGVTLSADLGNGPGIQEIATFSVDVSGPEGSVSVSHAHGTASGTAGGLLLRPFARLISMNGDIVTTYGEPWNLN